MKLLNNTIQYNYTTKTILCISDLHAPYEHPDALDFLAALKKKYKPDLIVNMGDLGDFHGTSFHDSDADLYSAGDELEGLREFASKLEALFPKMFIISSNHGDLPLRKALHYGMPQAFIRPFNEIYGVGSGWTFIDDLTLKTANNPDIFFAHAIKKNALQVAQQRSQRFVCSHFHTDFEIRYYGNPHELLWSMMCGCLIDKKSLAFRYDRLILNRPILGTGVIVNGYPRILPLVMDKKGRWIGKLL